MTTLEHTLLESVNHLLTRHPALAPQIETLAQQAQGHTLEEVRAFREWRMFHGLNTQQVFSKIYAEGLWGRSAAPEDRFFSGTGSRDETVVAPYIEAVRNFLRSLDPKPRVVDLGCGDFQVGQQLVADSQSYTACDIVPALIAHHRQVHQDLGVDFRVLDITRDELPDGDVVFVRQVLQHLSNAQIQAAITSLQKRYRWLVLTEHIPGSDPFVPNLDKPVGRDIRLFFGSGIDLSAPPFNLAAKKRVLCEAQETGGRIRTTLFDLR